MSLKISNQELELCDWQIFREISAVYFFLHTKPEGRRSQLPKEDICEKCFTLHF